MKLSTKILQGLLCLYCSNVFSASNNEQVTNVSYTVDHREAKRLITAIKPLYAGQLVFSSIGNKIFIRGEDSISTEAIALLQEMDQAERFFRLRLSQAKPRVNTKIYSAGQSFVGQNQVFTMTANKPLLISQRNETQSLSAAGSLWYETDTVIDREQTIELTMRLMTADRAEIRYRITHIDQDAKQLQANTVVVPINEWIALNSEHSSSGHWSINKNINNKGRVNSLFIKLETY